MRSEVCPECGGAALKSFAVENGFGAGVSLCRDCLHVIDDSESVARLVVREGVDETSEPTDPRRERAELDGVRPSRVSIRQLTARASSISIKRLGKRALLKGAAMYPIEHRRAPTTRGECADMERPCPYVSCRYHLYLDVHPRTGSIKINFPDREPDELEHSCALDVADEGGRTLVEVGDIVNVTRERLRQIEEGALRRLRAGGRYEDDNE